MIGYKSKDGLINIIPVKGMNNAYYHVSMVCDKTFVETYSKTPIAKSRISMFCNVCIDDLIKYETEGVEYELYNSKQVNDKKTNIYFIQSGDAVKIGTAENVESRIAQLQTGNPQELKLIHLIENASIKEELALHKKFSKYHIRGEWFNSKIINYIK